MKIYIAKLQHDHGIMNLKVTAMTRKGAIDQIMKAENCPRRSIVEIHVVYEYEIQGAYGQGWEMVTAAETLAEARQLLRDYNQNEPYPHRIVKKFESAA